MVSLFTIFCTYLVNGAIIFLGMYVMASAFKCKWFRGILTNVYHQGIAQHHSSRNDPLRMITGT